MQVEIIMPKMGESIQEGTILRWMKKTGDTIKKDETILEISTDKVDSEIPSPVSGVLTKIIAKERETVPVGAIIAYIENELAGNIEKQITENIITDPKHIQLETNIQTRSSDHKGERFYSPLVRKIVRQEKIGKEELSRISGTGYNARVTKHDIFKYLENRIQKSTGLPSEEDRWRIRNADLSALISMYPEPKYNIVRMDNIQRKMAEHMTRSVNTSPHVTVVDEVNLTKIVNYRFRILDKFESQQGFKLTLTPFFAFAAVRALKEFPIVNSSVEGDAIVYKNFINLGIAVASPTGLIVPVVRNAEEKSFINLARSLTDVAVRARTKKLVPEDVSDGTFSITNYGVFGNIIGTPIINQPQVAILGIGAIKKRPVVITEESNDKIEIHSMVYLTLSFDHRAIDGAIGGQFIARVKWHLENYDMELVK